MLVWAVFAWPIRLSRYAPKNAAGTEPRTIQPTRRRFTVPRRRCTLAPIGRISTAATRSLEIAADGLTPNRRISIGVISAPPPAPVIPTRKPITALPRTMNGSTCKQPSRTCPRAIGAGSVSFLHHALWRPWPSARRGAGRLGTTLDAQQRYPEDRQKQVGCERVGPSRSSRGDERVYRRTCGRLARPS